MNDVNSLIKVSSEAHFQEIVNAAADRIFVIFDPNDISQVRMILSVYVSDEGYCNDVLKRCNPNMLPELCRDDRDYSKYVLMQIRDQSLLKDIAERKIGSNWEYAFVNIDDEEFLRRLVSETDDDRRIHALKRLNDQQLISEIALKETDWKKRSAVFLLIDDPETADITVRKILKDLDQREPYVPALTKMLEHHDMLFCSEYDSSKLIYVDPFDGHPVVYSETCYDLEDHHYYEIKLKDHILKDWHNNESLKICFPDAMVALSDDSSDNELFICPKCSGLRRGESNFIKRCSCRSQLNAVRLRYDRIES